jgi:hypothetical protein
MSSESLGKLRLGSYTFDNCTDVVSAVTMFRFDGIEMTVAYFTLLDVLRVLEVVRIFVSLLRRITSAMRVLCRGVVQSQASLFCSKNPF